MRSKTEKRAFGVPWGRLASGLAALAMAVLFMKHSQLASAAVVKGLTLCVKTMIPSLFPFMVIAELIVHSGIGRIVARPVSRSLGRLLGVGEAASCALFLGVLCGFPVGARAAASYYRSGEMDARELNHVLCFCNVPSSAFLLGAVGSSLFGNVRIGQMLLALVLIAALLVGLALRFLLPHRIVTSERRGAPVPQVGVGGSLLSSAIASAAGSMQSVCATVLVFSALSGTLGQYTDALGLPEATRAVLFGLLELSTGIVEASALPDTGAAVVLCAAMAGWAGLSVHCQILSVCDGCPVVLGWFWMSRALQCFLCGGGMWLLLHLGWLDVQENGHGASVDTWVQESAYGRVWQTACVLAFLVAMAVWLTGKRKGGKRHEATAARKAY